MNEKMKVRMRRSPAVSPEGPLAGRKPAIKKREVYIMV
jgi:hypothetical protein